MQRVALVSTFAAALMAGTIAPLQAAPLPTNLTAMKSMAADGPVQVRWRHWRHGGGYARSWERSQEPAAFAFEHRRR
jgi:hypothetical protein